MLKIVSVRVSKSAEYLIHPKHPVLKGDDKVFILSEDHFTSTQCRDHVDAQAITGWRELGPQRAKNCYTACWMHTEYVLVMTLIPQ